MLPLNRKRVALPCCAMLLLALLAFPTLSGAHAAEYLNNKQLAEKLKTLSKEHRKIMGVASVAQTLGKQDVWLVELGSGEDGERNRRPALLVVAGIEGNDLVGSASAVNWLAELASKYESDQTIRQLLDTTTLYVFPRVNPDAAAHFFAKLKRETEVNGTPTDDDHDGLVDEDGAQDLNGDGLITSMRVRDPEGDYILDPSEPRLLLKADKLKGETGEWRLLEESRDQDSDEAWAEDGPGGVQLNRNFPYNYEFFAPWSGVHQVSEAETRALAEFVVDHPNIAVAFTFGAADNLLQPPKGEPQKRPPVTINDQDIPYYTELGKQWREALGLSKELKSNSEPGTFSDFMYFDRGRLSLAANPWSPAIQLAMNKAETKAAAEKPAKEGDAKPADNDEKKEGEKKPPAEKKEGKPAKADNRNEEDRAFLKWLDEVSPESFVTWKSYDHPDFEGKKVEIGGFAPFAKTNPPEKALDELTRKHGEFLTALAQKLPHLRVRSTKAKPLGSGVYDITVEIENTGYLPTALNQGNMTREIFPTRVTLKVEDEAVLSGSRTTRLETIAGSGAMKEARWIVHTKGVEQIDFEVHSVIAGQIGGTIDLGKAKAAVREGGARQ